MAYTPEEEQYAVASSIAENLLNIVGRGIDFPFRYGDFDSVGTIQTSTAGERIKDSIHVILATRIGERLFNPEFGSRLPDLVFEPNDEILQRLLVYYTYEALQRWERRIEVDNVYLINNLDEDKNRIGVSITYRILNSHIRGSYVYPFVKDGIRTGNLYTGSEVLGMKTAGQVV